MRRKRRIMSGLLALCIALSVLPLSACTAPKLTLDPEELYALPELPERYTALNKQLSAIQESGAEYAAPVSGSNIQPVQMVDLDGDGREEALAFFRQSDGEKPLKIYVFTDNGDSYAQTAVIVEGSGLAIYSVDYSDIDGDGRMEIIVGWRVSMDLQALAVYSLEPDGARELMRTNYVKYAVADLNKDGKRELTVLRANQDGEGVADCYVSKNGVLTLRSSVLVSMTMAEYLPGVVRGEMPASFEEEALKAQTCAARTYTAVLQKSAGHKHPDADICADSTCCQAYIERADAQARWGLNAQSYSEKIARAVADTDGLGVTYGGEPIQALFFSSSPGRTVDAAAVWGSRVDYLTGVDSPEGEEVPNYRSQVVLTAEQVRQMVLDAYPGADLSGDGAGWFSQRTENSAGGVASMLVGGVTLTGSQLRSLFSLRSTNFTVTYGAGSFTFDVVGYGHGVGMSQYGANAMAEEGADYKAILTHYYTGVTVEVYGG